MFFKTPLRNPRTSNLVCDVKPQELAWMNAAKYFARIAPARDYPRLAQLMRAQDYFERAWCVILREGAIFVYDCNLETHWHHTDMVKKFIHWNGMQLGDYSTFIGFKSAPGVGIRALVVDVTEGTKDVIFTDYGPPAFP